MKLVFIVCFLVLGGLLFVTVFKENPRQGMTTLEEGQKVIVSRAMPGLFFIPDKRFSLVKAGVKTVRPSDRRMDSESVRLSLAVYTEKEHSGTLITALAETPGEWEWIAARHLPYPVLRTVEEPYGREMLYESLFMLDASQNPFANKDSGKVLVYRGKFLLCLRKVQLLWEYQEPISDEEANVIDLKPDVQRAFLERGRRACTVRFIRKGETLSVVENPEKLAFLDDSFSRLKLAFWLGELKHPGSNR